MKKQIVRIILISLLVMPALVLPGCGGKKEESTPANASTQEPAAQEVEAEQEGLFEGREARDISEMKQYKEKALENAKQSRAVNHADKEEAELVEDLAEDFDEANALYRKGDYKQAQKAYEKILKTYPQHYGANVNLTLALLQQEENEEALVQALCSLSLFPTDGGIPLNVQTAAVASGFMADDAMEIAEEVVSESDDSNAKLSKKRKHELAYNRLWDRIETELWKAANGKGSDKQNREAYEALHEELSKEIESGLSDDEDAQALLAYLEAAGEQLGLTAQDESTEDKDTKDEQQNTTTSSTTSTKESKETKTDSSKTSETKAEKANIDFSTVEPHVGLPYVVLDDEDCTIIFTGYHMGTENPVAEFSMFNKTPNKRLRMEATDAHANGIEIENFSGAFVYVDPGEQGSGWGSFFGKDGDDVISLVKGELKELTCVVDVADVTGGSRKEMGTYPLSWKADESGKGEKSVKEKVIDEEGVFSLTATGIRGASDDVVGIEYSSSYPGKGKLRFDSKDDWRVNGVGMELIGADMPFEYGNGWHHFILLKTKNPGALGNDPVKTIEGTIVVKDESGKELTSQKLKL